MGSLSFRSGEEMPVRLFESFKIAFAMYSKIPMPKTDWDKENMRYAMCFFPLIGVVIAVLEFLWFRMAAYLSIGTLLYSAAAALIPVAVTGGIHLDGLLDTIDALSSYQTKERKLEILSDPHTGAFAIIGAISYFLLSVGFWSEVREEGIWLIMAGFVLSRALSGFAVVSLKPAKDKGLVSTFSEASAKQKVRIVMCVYIAVCAAVLLRLNLAMGAAVLAAALLVFLHYVRMSKKQFGGITGDLAGYFLQICEIVILAVCVLLERGINFI